MAQEAQIAPLRRHVGKSAVAGQACPACASCCDLHRCMRPHKWRRSQFWCLRMPGRAQPAVRERMARPALRMAGLRLSRRLMRLAGRVASSTASAASPACSGELRRVHSGGVYSVIQDFVRLASGVCWEPMLCRNGLWASRQGVPMGRYRRQHCLAARACTSMMRALFHAANFQRALPYGRPRSGTASPGPASAPPTEPENTFYYDSDLKMWRERGVAPPPAPEVRRPRAAHCCGAGL